MEKLLQELQSAGGAGVNAQVAVGAAGDSLFGTELGLDDGGETTANQTQQALLGNFLTGTDAQTAQDALAVVALDGHQLGLAGGLALLAGKAAGVDFV